MADDTYTELPDEPQLSGIGKYKKTIAYIEEELYTTLNYLNNQLDLIDEQIGDTGEHAAPLPFNRNVYDSKKQIVEQKLVALRSLAGVASEQVKVTDKTKGSEIASITELFQN